MKRLLVAIAGLIALVIWGVPIATAQTHSYGTNNLKLCVTAATVVTVINPSQACPLGQQGYLITASLATDPPEVNMTAKINADGTIASQSVVTNAAGNATNWIASSSVTNSSYTITFAGNFFVTAPNCTEKLTTAAPSGSGAVTDMEAIDSLVYKSSYIASGSRSYNLTSYNSAADIECKGRSSLP